MKGDVTWYNIRREAVAGAQTQEQEQVRGQGAELDDEQECVAASCWLLSSSEMGHSRERGGIASLR